MEGNVTQPADRLKIVILGSGNVATHLAPALARHYNIIQVYSRTFRNALALASIIGAQAVDDLNDLATDADVYVMAVADDAIKPIADKLKHINDALWLHTSGSIDMKELMPLSSRYGVLYPMMTFSKEAKVDMTGVPIFIEGSDAATVDMLRDIAEHLSTKVHETSTADRRLLHVAAVFSCNFANHMWAQAADVLKRIGLGFDIMRPLIQATLDKTADLDPAEGQTGPARRGDLSVINSHLEMLQRWPHFIYETLSQSIYYKYHKPR